MTLNERHNFKIMIINVFIIKIGILYIFDKNFLQAQKDNLINKNRNSISPIVPKQFFN